MRRRLSTACTVAAAYTYNNCIIPCYDPSCRALLGQHTLRIENEGIFFGKKQHATNPDNMTSYLLFVVAFAC